MCPRRHCCVLRCFVTVCVWAQGVEPPPHSPYTDFYGSAQPAANRFFTRFSPESRAPATRPLSCGARVNCSLTCLSSACVCRSPLLGVRVSLAPALRARVARLSSACACRSPQLGARRSFAPARRARVARLSSACACRSPLLCVRVSLAPARRARVARLSSACACRSRKVGVRVFLGFVHPVCRVCGLPETYKRDTPALLLLWRRCQTLRLLHPTHLLVPSVLAWRPADSVM